MLSSIGRDGFDRITDKTRIDHNVLLLRAQWFTEIPLNEAAMFELAGLRGHEALY
jgi:hypothetical protein